MNESETETQTMAHHNVMTGKGKQNHHTKNVSHDREEDWTTVTEKNKKLKDNKGDVPTGNQIRDIPIRNLSQNK